MTAKIFELIDENNLNALRELLKKDISQIILITEKNHAVSAFRYAAIKGKWDCVSIMVDAMKEQNFNAELILDAGGVILFALKIGKSVASSMLKLNIRTNAADISDHNSCLYWAVYHDFPDLIGSILKNGSPLHRNLEGVHPIELAIDKGHQDCVVEIFSNLSAQRQHLLKDVMESTIYKVVNFGQLRVLNAYFAAGFTLSPDTYDKNGTRKAVTAGSLFYVAAGNNNPLILEALISFYNKQLIAEQNKITEVSKLSKERQYKAFVEALFVALRHANSLDNTDCVKVIVRFFNQEPKCVEFMREYPGVARSPLYDAFWKAIYEDDQETVEALLSFDSEIAKFLCNSDISGESPLHYLAQKKRTKLVPKILAAGALQTVNTVNRRTPMDEAIASSAWDVASLLIEDPNFVQANENRLGGYVRQLLQDKKAALVHQILSLNAKMDVNTLNKDGDAIIHLAAQFANFKLDLLEKYNPHTHIRNAKGKLPFEIAADNLNFKFLTWLYKKDKTQMNVGQVFDLAATCHQNDLVAMMLKNQPHLCEVNNKYGNVFLKLALDRGWYDLISILIANGANPFGRETGGKSFYSYAYNKLSRENPALLAEIEDKSITRLAVSTTLDFRNLTANQANHTKHADAVKKIVTESMDLLHVLAMRLRRKQETVVPNRQELRLLEIFNIILSRKQKISALRDLKIETDAMIDLPEAQFVSQFIAQMDIVADFRHRLSQLINQFYHDVDTKIWKKDLFLFTSNTPPRHIAELLKEIKHQTRQIYKQGYFDLFETGPVVVIYNLIRQKLANAISADSKGRHDETVQFYTDHLNEFNAITFTPISSVQNAQRNLIDDDFVIVEDSTSTDHAGDASYADPLHATKVSAPLTPTVEETPGAPLCEDDTHIQKRTMEQLFHRDVEPLLPTNPDGILLSQNQAIQVELESSTSTSSALSVFAVYADNKEMPTLYPFEAANLEAPRHEELYTAFVGLPPLKSTNLPVDLVSEEKAVYTLPEPSAPATEAVFATSMNATYAGNSETETLYPFAEAGLNPPSYAELYPVPDYLTSQPSKSTKNIATQTMSSSSDLIIFGDDQTVATTSLAQQESLLDLQFETNYTVPSDVALEPFAYLYEMAEAGEVSETQYKTGNFVESEFEKFISQMEDEDEKLQSQVLNNAEKGNNKSQSLLQTHSLLKDTREKTTREKKQTIEKRTKIFAS